MPTELDLLGAVRHVVHEYANLVSSGTIAVCGSHRGKALCPPINAHVGEAFLVNCRKMYEFLKGEPQRDDDLRACQYLQDIESPPFDLPEWTKWHRPMNKRLLHITLTRDERPPWEGHAENKAFLAEFKAAWALLRSSLPEKYKSKFKTEIAEKVRVNPWLGGFDLP